MASPILAGLTILMLGDSHFATPGYLITTLQDALMANGAKVVTEAACGAASGVWVGDGIAPCGAAERINNGPVRTNKQPNARVPLLQQLVAQIHPNLIIIGGGDTMAGYAQKSLPTQYIDENINPLTRQIQADGIACVWVGPGWGTEGGPYFKTYARAQQMSDYLSTHVAPCRYINSLQFAKPGEWSTFDGQHYSQVGYQKWGAAIAGEILQLAQTKPQ
jgi:lysophospholipase L1-like esterase